MKGLFKLAVGCLILGASAVGFAATKTDMTKNWTCTTNASSSSVESEKAAVEKLAETKASTSNAFTAAADNCRDCTKITFEVDD